MERRKLMIYLKTFTNSGISAHFIGCLLFWWAFLTFRKYEIIILSLKQQKYSITLIISSKILDFFIFQRFNY